MFDLISWVSTNWLDVVNVVSYLIAAATIIVKLTPTMKDDVWLKKVIDFLSKYIALNK